MLANQERKVTWESAGRKAGDAWRVNVAVNRPYDGGTGVKLGDCTRVVCGAAVAPERPSEDSREKFICDSSVGSKTAAPPSPFAI